MTTLLDLTVYPAPSRSFNAGIPLLGPAFLFVRLGPCVTIAAVQGARNRNKEGSHGSSNENAFMLSHTSFAGV